VKNLLERTITSRRVFQGRLLTVRVDDVLLENGRPATREIVEHPGAVAMIALDGQGSEERIALVRQFRTAAEQSLLEIPAGTLEAGEEPLACAQRELFEETGLTARRWTHVQTFYTAPGFCTEQMWLYLAQETQRAAKSQAASDEQIEVCFHTRPEVLKMLQAGQFQDAKTLVGLLWWLRTT
jgi:ADP-ribose pyrophosphatase